MKWNPHNDIESSHAFLAPSKCSWLNYDEDKLCQSFSTWEAAARGSELHSHAKDDILFGLKFGIKRPATKTTYNMYVNDAIGFRMRPEQLLYYNEYAYGTADAISFNKKILRIHDLKTGITPAKIDQLRIYAALFCLEYGKKPSDITIILRIYQNNEIVGEDSDPNIITNIMDKMIYFTKVIDKFKGELH